jgi:hypothetical protein
MSRQYFYLQSNHDIATKNQASNHAFHYIKIRPKRIALSSNTNKQQLLIGKY